MDSFDKDTDNPRLQLHENVPQSNNHSFKFKTFKFSYWIEAWTNLETKPAWDILMMGKLLFLGLSGKSSKW